MSRLENALVPVLRNTGLYTLINVVGTFLLNILYVRLLGLETYGKLTFYVSIGALVYSLSTLGIASSFTRSFTAYLVNKNITISYILGVMGVSLLMFSFLGIIVLSLVTCVFDLTTDDQKFILFTSVIHLLLALPISIVTSLYESTQNIAPIRRINILAILVKFTLLYWVFLFKDNLPIVISCYFILPQLVVLGLGLYYVANDKDLVIVKGSIRENRRDIYAVVNFSIRSILQTCSEVCINAVPNYFLKVNYTFVELGVYRIINTLIKIGLLLPHLVGKVLLPFLTRLFALRKTNVMRFYFTFSSKILFSFMLVLSLAIIIFKNYWFHVFGEDFSLSDLEVFVLGGIIYVLSSNFVGSLLASIDRPLVMAVSSFVSTVVATIALFVINDYPPILSTLFFLAMSYTLNQGFLLIYVMRLSLFDWSSFRMKSLLEIILLAGSGFLMYVENGNIGIIGLVSVYIILVLICIVILHNSLDLRDRKVIRRLWKVFS